MGNSTIATVDDSSFDAKVLSAAKPVLVLFTANENGPSEMLESVVQGLAEAYEDRLLIYKCEVFDSPQTASKSGVSAVPTLHIYIPSHYHYAPSLHQRRMRAL